jgi:hypothetical protein
LHDRLDEWLGLRQSPAVPELPKVAGAQGELAVHRVLGRHDCTRFGDIFGANRVPRIVGSAAAGRYEIHLIAITPRRVVAFEVKHWSGKVTVDGEKWVYIRRSGEVQAFDDLAMYNAGKVACLRRYLRERLLRHPKVVTLGQLAGPRQRLPRQTPRLAGDSC